jgi:hypothetical protein
MEWNGMEVHVRLRQRLDPQVRTKNVVVSDWMDSGTRKPASNAKMGIPTR